MAEQKRSQLVAPENNEIKLKSLITKEEVEKRFKDVLRNEANAKQYLGNVATTVSNNNLLKACSPSDILACAFTGATVDLPILPALGFAAIVPYKKNTKDENGKWSTKVYPQFQIMTKGFIQLALRSEQVTSINITDVYSDELTSYNRLTGEITMRDVPDGQRSQGLTDSIIGYACYVRLRNGFEKTVYWSVADIRKHAERYSQAYQYDLKEGKATSPWSTNFAAMAKKTVVKATITNWVPMSTQMRFATLADQSTSQHVTIGPNGEIEGTFSYADNEIPEVPEEPTPGQSKADSFKAQHNIGNEPAPQPEPEQFDDDDIPWPEADDSVQEEF